MKLSVSEETKWRITIDPGKRDHGIRLHVRGSALDAKEHRDETDCVMDRFADSGNDHGIRRTEIFTRRRRLSGQSF
jgi:hypothetical protein